MNKIATRHKWLMAIGLMLVYLPLGIYVNSDDRTWDGIVGRIFPDFIVQFIISTVVTFGWICLAEWLRNMLLKQFSRLSTIWFNLLAGSLFFMLSMTVITMVLQFNEWLFYGTLKMEYPIGDLSHANRAVYGQFATLSLCVYTLIANRQIMDNIEATRLKAEQLEKENLLSQFSALKSQVNPHFLFNSLSILSSLVKKDPDLSEQFIDRLSKAYRYILEQRDTDLVPLATELDFLKSYTFLLQTRFGQKFEVKINLDDETVATSKIPPLTLQLLVENAVKHNRMSETEPLQITIGQEVGQLVVRNNFRPRGDKPNSTGMGLQNIINRYALLTDQPVWAGETEADFVVKVPLLQ